MSDANEQIQQMMDVIEGQHRRLDKMLGDRDVLATEADLTTIADTMGERRHRRRSERDAAFVRLEKRHGSDGAVEELKAAAFPDPEVEEQVRLEKGQAARDLLLNMTREEADAYLQRRYRGHD